MASPRALVLAAALALAGATRVSNSALTADAQKLSEATERMGKGCYCQGCAGDSAACTAKIAKCYPTLAQTADVFYDYTSVGGQASLQYGFTPLDSKACKGACEADGFQSYCSKIDAGKHGNYHWSKGFDCWAVSDDSAKPHQHAGVIEAAADPCFFSE
mmetsp:Transcript_55655/g.125605  ORF Transcript_55655/g.125605 Transcript_55655/m.125605 type:complete len:159 (-) Transcript_55655:162-638(-)